MSDFEKATLRKSLTKMGMIISILCTMNYAIIGGHLRAEQLKALEVKAVPILRIDVKEGSKDFIAMNLALS